MRDAELEACKSLCWQRRGGQALSRRWTSRIRDIPPLRPNPRPLQRASFDVLLHLRYRRDDVVAVCAATLLRPPEMGCCYVHARRAVHAVPFRT